MIHADKRALDHLGIKSKLESIYSGIGAYGDYLYSDDLDKFKWSSAPYFSPDELLTFISVQKQFQIPYSGNARTNYYPEIVLKSKYQAKIDGHLYDLLYDAIDNDLEHTPIFPTSATFFPYEDKSLLRSGIIGGKSIHDEVLTDEDFLALNDSGKDSFIGEFCVFIALKYYIVGHMYDHTKDVHIISAVNKASSYIERSHPLYQARKWGSIRNNLYASRSYFGGILDTHIENRGLLVYSS